jgi:potassium/hydrogen antiporter
VYSILAGPREVTVDAAPLERLDATMLHFTIPEGSRLAGLYPAELRLPGDAAVSLIQRDGKLFVPGQHSILRAHDQLLVAPPTGNEQPLRVDCTLLANSGG